MHAFHGEHWGNWQFLITNQDLSNNTITWERGGFQEARGDNEGAEWYVENLFEELDVPAEWFFDADEQILYYYLNVTDLAGSEFIASKLDTILSIQGSQSRPVRNVTITGLTFSHTQTTFTEDYEVSVFVFICCLFVLLCMSLFVMLC